MISGGSLIHREMLTEFPCPHCNGRLQEFQYRLYSLKLDFCTEKHGFWLDAGEDERVLEIMGKRHAEIHRKDDAENEWKQMLTNLHAAFKKL